MGGQKKFESQILPPERRGKKIKFWECLEGGQESSLLAGEYISLGNLVPRISSFLAALHLFLWNGTYLERCERRDLCPSKNMDLSRVVTSKQDTC